ncbi:MAG: sugar phosphate isomerase/epimerase, partial [Planctomycetota bacterium]
MKSNPNIILSGFADEAANEKTAIEQFAAFAALGLQYYSIRFIDVGQGVKNVMQLTKTEINTIRHLQTDYGLEVSSIGSPIGKTKLLDKDDGTSNSFTPFKTYLSKDVYTACDRAHAFGAKLIRGFSFYHPKGEAPEEHLPQVI